MSSSFDPVSVSFNVITIEGEEMRGGERGGEGRDDEEGGLAFVSREKP